MTFRGGEPLTAGRMVLQQALDGLEKRFGRGRYQVAMQSNLWLLDDEFCRLFAQHKVDIGTSLDGPDDITDSQRGEGYFTRTTDGIRRARRHGMSVGCIATFTPLSVPRWRDVFGFFLDERLNFSIHASVPPLEAPTSSYALTPSHYGVRVLVRADQSPSSSCLHREWPRFINREEAVILS